MKWKILILLLCLPVTITHALRVGNVWFKPPFVITGQTGLDMELMHRICHCMKVTCTYQPMRLPELYTALAENKIDLAIGGITISPLKSNVLYSLPYLPSKGHFVVTADIRAKSVADLAPHTKIGVIRESAYETYLKTHYPDQLQIVVYDAMIDMLTDMKTHVISGILIDDPMATYWVQNSSNAQKLLGNPIPIGDGFGIMAAPQNANLIREVNQCLLRMEEDGSYLTLYKTYFN
ncbi:transporter substrate-binding domain-containing protein [Legionella spiritensis]|uniref:Arginine-binding periplasmic protein n=1 Tax=Legionella spiritensis TaxID=452 RepID=A0A0W0YYT1_LEGSP|nr:transporter substrate-binding domain-containing protein [Legionella spiritensis]KTD61747.1 arginine-binding periplasmic protein [Legionella spiritensis]SNV38630.1 arginine-binding periplasmic protein [Legionella spiritensis]